MHIILASYHIADLLRCIRTTLYVFCRLHVYTVRGEDELSLEDHLSFDTAGIFDMRWLSSAQDGPPIALATSDGMVSLVANRADALEVGTMFPVCSFLFLVWGGRSRQV